MRRPVLLAGGKEVSKEGGEVFQRHQRAEQGKEWARVGEGRGFLC